MIAIFRKDVIKAGGIETWLNVLARRYGKSHDIVLYYDSIDKMQLHRLSKYIRCTKYNNTEVECDKAIFCYDFMGIDNVKAKEYIHIVHADYKEINLAAKTPSKITSIYAVSKQAAKSFTEVTGLECGVMYNPVDPCSDYAIRLVSATGLSPEKGLGRMRRLAEALDKSNIKYHWDIYTPDPQPIDSPNVTVHKPRSDVRAFVNSADFLVQLSDTESFSYSVVEALTDRVPVIATDLPVFKELGMTSDHGIFISLDKTDYSDLPALIESWDGEVNYKPPEDKWEDILGKPTGSDYVYEGGIVECIVESVYLVDENTTLKLGDTMIIDSDKRLKQLVDGKYVKVIN